jgi:flagellar biosynthesis protein FlhB
LIRITNMECDLNLIISFYWGSFHHIVLGLFQCEVSSSHLLFSHHASCDVPIRPNLILINLFSGQHRVVSQKTGVCELKTVVNKVQSFRIVFIYQTTSMISISAALKLSCNGCLLWLAVYIMLYYILYTSIYCIYIYIY